MRLERSPSSGESCMISLVPKLTASEDFVLETVTHSLRVAEGVQPSCGASWAREVAGTCIACEVSFAKAFLVFFPSPRWEGFAVHPASWTDSVLLSYLAREHIVFAFQMPRAL